MLCLTVTAVGDGGTQTAALPHFSLALCPWESPRTSEHHVLVTKRGCRLVGRGAAWVLVRSRWIPLNNPFPPASCPLCRK